MPKYVQLPNGGLFPLNEGEDPADALAEARKRYPDVFGIKEKEKVAPPEGGFVAATKSGISKLKGDVAALAGRSGLMDIPTAEKIRKEEEEY
jgi:hypothetical protein